MFCAFCGKKIEEGLRICPYCHESVEAETLEILRQESDIETEESDATLSENTTAPAETDTALPENITDMSENAAEESEAEAEAEENAAEESENGTDSEENAAEELENGTDSEENAAEESEAEAEAIKSEAEIAGSETKASEMRASEEKVPETKAPVRERYVRHEDPEAEEKRLARKKRRKVKMVVSLVVLALGLVLLIGVIYVMVSTLFYGDSILLPEKETATESIVEAASVQAESVTPEVTVTPKAEEVQLREEDFLYSGAIEFQTQSFQFTLPDYWNNLANCQVNDDNSIDFYQKKSVEAGTDGLIFSVAEIFSEDMPNYAPCRLLRREGDISYVLMTPGVVTYAEDPYIELEYTRLQSDASYVFQSFSLIGEEILVTPEPTPEAEEEPEDEEAEVPDTTDAEGYILPESSTRYLTLEDLEGLSSDQLWVARNEIYARKGRMFDNADLQAYFDSKGWYNGSIAPDDFSNDMLTDIEKKNAELIRSLE